MFYKVILAKATKMAVITKSKMILRKAISPEGTLKDVKTNMNFVKKNLVTGSPMTNFPSSILFSNLMIL